MTAAELAEHTGARLVMPTVPLHRRPAGSCTHYFSTNNVGSKHAKPLESTRQRMEGGAPPIPAHADHAASGSGARSDGPLVRRVA